MNEDRKASDLLNGTGYYDSNFTEIFDGDVLVGSGGQLWDVWDNGRKYMVINRESGYEKELKDYLSAVHRNGLTVSISYDSEDL